ncbi:MAG: hypothetical protein Q7J57_03830 [Gemmobacter sp.]|nr:hypothetical protein [Gemmobacter sp.]
MDLTRTRQIGFCVAMRGFPGGIVLRFAAFQYLIPKGGHWGNNRVLDIANQPNHYTINGFDQITEGV